MILLINGFDTMNLYRTLYPTTIKVLPFQTQGTN